MFEPKNVEVHRVIGFISRVDEQILEWKETDTPCVEFSLMVGEVTGPKLILRVYIRTLNLCRLAAHHIKQGTRLVRDEHSEKDEPEEDELVAHYVSADLAYARIIANPSNSFILRERNGD